MPVNIPKSGDPITKASITGMFDTVRGIVNAQGPSTIQRGTFSDVHLPSLVLQADFREVTVREDVLPGPYGNGTPPPTFDETSSATWQELTNYTMLDGGTDYMLDRGIILMFASIRWQRQNIDLTASPQNQELWMNFHYTVNGVAYRLTRNNRMLRAGEDISVKIGDNPTVYDPDWPRTVEETFTWWDIVDTRPTNLAKVPFRMGVRATPQRATGNCTTTCELPNGFIGFVNLYGG